MTAVASSGTATVTLPTDEQILITREFDAPKYLVTGRDHARVGQAMVVGERAGDKRGDRPAGRRRVGGALWYEAGRVAFHASTVDRP